MLDFSDWQRNWEFPVSFDREFSVRISGWENFPSEDQYTGNSQSLQSGAIILRQRVTIQSAQGGGGTLLNQGDGRKGPTLAFLPGAVTAVKMRDTPF